MSTLHITTGLNLTARTAKRMASQAFLSNKRTTEVNLNGHDSIYVLEYRGPRVDADTIAIGVQVLRRIEKDNT